MNFDDCRAFVGKRIGDRLIKINRIDDLDSMAARFPPCGHIGSRPALPPSGILLFPESEVCMAQENPTSSVLIRVGVADKSPLIQAALKQILSEDERFTLVHVSSGCEDFLQNLAKESIDVGVIGWIFGPCDGRLILDRVNAQANPPRIVVYTGLEKSTLPTQVMAHGGAAFVSKSEQPFISARYHR